MKLNEILSPSIRQAQKLFLSRQMICKCCGQDLPLTSFERFKTGTYRKMCWQCRWAVNGKGVRKRSLLRHETG